MILLLRFFLIRQEKYDKIASMRGGDRVELLINEKQNGKSILEILRGELAFSSSSITFLKHREDGILLNGEHVTVRKTVATGDKLSLHYEDTEESLNESLLPVKLPLEIIYSDRDIMIVNKPPYMPTHPSHDHQCDTLANALAFHFKSRKTPFVFRAINRLDSQTSGLVMIARNKISAQRLSEDMRAGKIRKSYFAVLHGSLQPPEGRINAPIKRAEDSKMLRIVCEDGAPSLTQYKTIVANEMYSAVYAAPITGRTHQLRVHFSSKGNRICGDTLYGYPCEYINRQALHAFRLEFPHPSSGEPMCIYAPLPDDMKALCQSVFSFADQEKLKQQKGLYYDQQSSPLS